MNRLSFAFAGGLLVALVASSVSAGTVNFDFNSLSNNATTGTVQSYLNSAASGLGLPSATLNGCSGSVAVCITNNAGSSGIASNRYTGDGHVIGPVYSYPGSSNDWVVPITLGTTDQGTPSSGFGNGAGQVRDGAGTGVNGTTNNSPAASGAGTNDTFLYTASGTYITITFSAPVILMSFDWEIFPNANCKDASSCSQSNWPDLTVRINGTTADNSNGTLIFSALGVDPQDYSPDGQSWCGTANSSTCPTSGNTYHYYNERAPQLIGVYNAPGGGLTNVTSVTFADWPAAIGFDNLQVKYPPPGGGVPMPAGLVLMALGGAFLGWRAQRQR